MKKLIILPDIDRSPNMGLKRWVNINFKAKLRNKLLTPLINPKNLFFTPIVYHQKGKAIRFAKPCKNVDLITAVKIDIFKFLKLSYWTRN